MQHDLWQLRLSSLALVNFQHNHLSIDSITDESEARKELRGMIQSYLTDEIKKMKLTMDEQLKSTEDLLNKKLDIAEGGGAKKGGRNSAKGNTKKKW